VVLLLRQSIGVGAVPELGPSHLGLLSEILFDFSASFPAEGSLLLARHTMDVLEMSTQVSTLCEGLVALWATERP
jgi:hypothetical protein